MIEPSLVEGYGTTNDSGVLMMGSNGAELHSVRSSVSVVVTVEVTVKGAMGA